MNRIVCLAIAVSCLSCGAVAEPVTEPVTEPKSSPKEFGSKYLELLGDNELIRAKAMQCVTTNTAVLGGLGRLKAESWSQETKDGFSFSVTTINHRGTEYRLAVWDTEVFRKKRAVDANNLAKLGVDLDEGAEFSDGEQCVTAR